MSKNASKNQLSQLILQFVEQNKPANVEQLVTQVKEKTGIPEKKIIDQIFQLQGEGKITFHRPPRPPIPKLSIYLRTEHAYWFWTTIITATITTIVVFTFAEDAYPMVYIRYVLGTIFVLWLPGYTFIKALFPSEPPLKTSSKNLDTIERIALSIGMSLALVPIVGLLLNYTPWGIRLTPIVLSLLALTTVFAIAAIIREYQQQLKREN
ncbi:MAG: DUF1616 domain-containing protein [Candidatus Bathyarchaeia archaeon]|nr:DUF1616 domain-containing protein [Candidatus Bathyarchaeota archaeon]